MLNTVSLLQNYEDFQIFSQKTGIVIHSYQGYPDHHTRFCSMIFSQVYKVVRFKNLLSLHMSYVLLSKGHSVSFQQFYKQMKICECCNVHVNV